MKQGLGNEETLEVGRMVKRLVNAKGAAGLLWWSRTRTRTRTWKQNNNPTTQWVGVAPKEVVAVAVAAAKHQQ